MTTETDGKDGTPGNTDAIPGTSTGTDTATATASPKATAPKPASPRKQSRLPWILFFMLLLVVAGGVGGVLLLPRAVETLPALARWLPASEDAGGVNAVARDLEALDARTAALGERLERQARSQRALDDEIAADRATLASLQRRVAALEDRPEGMAAPLPERPAATTGSPGNDALAGRLDALDRRLAALEFEFQPLDRKISRLGETLQERATLDGSLDRVTDRLAGVEQRLGTLERSAAGDGRGTLIALSFAALRDAAVRGRPFAQEAETLRGLLIDARQHQLAARLSTIAPHGSGVPTLAALRDSFEELGPEILRAGHLPEDAAWWQRALASLRGLVVVRPTGEATGDGTAAVIARAERRLAAGDLGAAARELEKLPDGVQPVAAEWLRAARNRLELDDALARFSTALIKAASRDLEALPAVENPDDGTDAPDPAATPDDEGA